MRYLKKNKNKILWALLVVAMLAGIGAGEHINEYFIPSLITFIVAEAYMITFLIANRGRSASRG